MYASIYFYRVLIVLSIYFSLGVNSIITKINCERFSFNEIFNIIIMNSSSDNNSQIAVSFAFLTSKTEPSVQVSDQLSDRVIGISFTILNE